MHWWTVRISCRITSIVVSGTSCTTIHATILLYFSINWVWLNRFRWGIDQVHKLKSVHRFVTLNMSMNTYKYHYNGVMLWKSALVGQMYYITVLQTAGRERTAINTTTIETAQTKYHTTAHVHACTLASCSNFTTCADSAYPKDHFRR